MTWIRAIAADPVRLGSLMVGFSAVCFGMIPFFARSLIEAGLAPPAIAFYRYMFAAVAFLPFLRLRGAQGRASLWGYASGFLVGLGWVGYVRSLELLPVAVAGVLYMTYPLFTLIVGLFFGDRPAGRAVLGAALIVAAAALATQTDLGGQPVTLIAVLFALAAPMAFGLSINVLAHKLAPIPPISRIASFATGSATGLVPLILTYPATEVIPAGAGQWGLVLALGIFSALLPQFIYTTWVPRIGGARAAALGAIELPTMFAVGWIAFGEAAGPRDLAAGALVLTAILMTPARPPRPKEGDLHDRP
jgi:drug/metabolite transporter (DMT)-like permease